MEYVKSPTYPMQPMPMPMPAPAPMPMPIQVAPPPAPIMHKPYHHNDIHLHASYQQTQFVFPKPVVQPVAVAKVCSHHHHHNSVGSILVLFILLVIITRGIIKC
ncbi:hypothetical protein [Paenibacillus alba]|uniref:hypothetical protein n=1 Tax=Paenibacillus alba TaxID=1197127 RepID=UPI001567C58B|nr:hypothetical protein [Paenibacillus alba]